MNLWRKWIKKTKTFSMSDLKQFFMTEFIVREVLKEVLDNATIVKSYTPTRVEPEELTWMYLEYERLERPMHKAKFLQEHPEFLDAKVINGDQIWKIKVGDTDEQKEI